MRKGTTCRRSALPANASSVKSSLAGHDVGGLTPTAPALQGAVDAAKAQKTANPTHASAVVLVTDGFPTDCAPIDIPGVSAIAQGGKTAGVSTYVIGVFTKDEESAAKTNLNKIAAACLLLHLALILLLAPASTLPAKCPTSYAKPLGCVTCRGTSA